MTRTLTCALTTIVLLAANGGRPAAQPSDGPTPLPAVAGAATGPEASSSPRAIRACTLLTAAEVATLIARASTSPATDRISGAQLCTWKPTNAVLPRLEVGVAPHDQRIKAGSLQLVQGTWHLEAPEHHGHYLENLGDAAVVESGIVDRDVGQTEIRAYVGDTLVWVQLRIASGPSWTQTLDSAIAKQPPLVALSRSVIARLREAR